MCITDSIHTGVEQHDRHKSEWFESVLQKAPTRCGKGVKTLANLNVYYRKHQHNVY